MRRRWVGCRWRIRSSATCPSWRAALWQVSLLGLATHGGRLSAAVPDTVRDRAQLMAYLQAWQPSYAEGTRRTYANPSIGMLGVATANAMGQAYVPLMQGTLLPKLGLPSTYLQVPADQMARYAQGYDKRNQPVRVSPGVLADGLRRQDQRPRPAALRGAEPGRHQRRRQAGSGHRRHAPGLFRTGRHDAGPGLGSTAIRRRWIPCWKAIPTRSPSRRTTCARCVRRWRRARRLINKTGATNGFGAYVAFVPGRRVGIVILANRNYPNADRVHLAYECWTRWRREAVEQARGAVAAAGAAWPVRRTVSGQRPAPRRRRPFSAEPQRGSRPSSASRSRSCSSRCIRYASTSTPA